MINSNTCSNPGRAPLTFSTYWWAGGYILALVVPIPHGLRSPFRPFSATGSPIPPLAFQSLMGSPHLFDLKEKLLKAGISKFQSLMGSAHLFDSWMNVRNLLGTICSNPSWAPLTFSTKTMQNWICEKCKVPIPHGLRSPFRLLLMVNEPDVPASVPIPHGLRSPFRLLP